MRRLTGIRFAVALLAATFTLTACNQVDQARGGVNKTKECASVASKLTGIDLNPRTAPAEVEAKAKELQDTVNGLTSEDVKAAGQALAGKLGELTQALRGADKAKVNAAIDDVRTSAEQLARTCNVPVDQILGQ